MRRLFEALVLPPASVLLLLVLGTLLRRRWPRTGRALQIAGVSWLWLASTPLLAGLLLGSLQYAGPLPATGPLPAADAIVVLSAEADVHGREYGGATIGAMTLQRVRYAAQLHRRTGLPILVSGGKPSSDAPSMAALMATALQQEFSAPVRWLEERSADTWQNAEFSAALLAADDVRRILLVTTAWHIPRAGECFQQRGFEVVPAPTGFRGPAFQSASSLLPHWQALRDTGWFLHEVLGRLYYKTLR